MNPWYAQEMLQSAHCWEIMLIIIITLGLLIGTLVSVVYSAGSFTPVIDGPIGCLPGFPFLLAAQGLCAKVDFMSVPV